jgi:RND family efflux transporter MFP subunit
VRDDPPHGRGHEHEHEHDGEVAPRHPSALRLIAMGIVIVATFSGLAWAGLRGRGRQLADRAAAHDTSRPDRPKVLTVVAEKAPSRVDQVLPGTSAPLFQTAVYARTNGYLKRRLVDIGDRVKEGQLLAEIETPEVDNALLQARASLSQSKATLERNRANERLAHVNLARTRRLFGSASVSQQEYDDADAAYRVAVATTQVSEAAIEANAANVKRLEDLQAFQRVTAPFDGVITARNYDTGALIVADDANSAELFHVARIDTLRVIADVPQTFATAVRPGLKAPVFRREAAGREFPGTVARTTSLLDSNTRTLRVEVEVPNADGALLPGMYLQVRFQLEAPSDAVRVPGAAVITRAEGTKLAVLDPRGAVSYRAINVGRDFGTMVEVLSGLSGGETIVVRPGDDLPEGAVVDPVGTTTL